MGYDISTTTVLDVTFTSSNQNEEMLHIQLKRNNWVREIKLCYLDKYVIL